MKLLKIDNITLFIVALIEVLTVFIVSQSIASSLFLLLTLALGYSIILLTSGGNKTDIIKVFLISFCVITFFTVIQWLGNEASINIFSDEDNDQFKFWTASQRGASALSIRQLYKECIVDNIYLKNGGYYLYIQTIAFFATKISDGNHLLLQHFGTATAGILSSIFIYHILKRFCLPKNVVKYSIVYMLLTPIILGSIVLTRDAIITFFYSIIIYLWICKEPSVKIVLLQTIICIVLSNLRLQHGLFALAFVVLSILTSTKKIKYVYVAGFIGILLVYGLTMFDTLIYSVVDTFEYYDNYTDDFLDSVNSGLGRYVFMLPSPIKEVAQVFFLQLQFPSWGAMSNANNFYHFLTGFLRFVINVFWFYIFCYVISGLCAFKIKQLPKTLVYGLLLFLFFLILNSSALELRRVICVYPIMFSTYVFYKDFVSSSLFNLNVKKIYSFIYISLGLFYFVATSLL